MSGTPNPPSIRGIGGDYWIIQLPVVSELQSFTQLIIPSLPLSGKMARVRVNKIIPNTSEGKCPAKRDARPDPQFFGTENVIMQDLTPNFFFIRITLIRLIGIQQ